MLSVPHHNLPVESRFITRMIVVMAFGAVALLPCIAMLIHTPAAQAGLVTMRSRSSSDDALVPAVSGPVWAFSTTDAVYSPSNTCRSVGRLQLLPASYTFPHYRSRAQWSTLTPPSMSIVAVSIPQSSVLVDQNLTSDGYQASYFYAGGSATIAPSSHCCGNMSYGSGISRFLNPTRYFGWQVVCEATGGCIPPNDQDLDVGALTLAPLQCAPAFLTGRGLAPHGEGQSQMARS